MFGDGMINAKYPYVGHGLRVRRRRTRSPLTTYFLQSYVGLDFLPDISVSLSVSGE
jgi:hypothetical protein